MDDSVAIRADRAQVADWIDLVPFTNASKGFQMMYVNKPLSNLSVCLGEVEPTYDATRTIVCDTFLTCFWASLVSVDRYPLFASLKEADIVWNLLGQSEKKPVCKILINRLRNTLPEFNT